MRGKILIADDEFASWQRSRLLLNHNMEWDAKPRIEQEVGHKVGTWYYTPLFYVAIGVCRVHFHLMKVNNHAAIFKNIQTDEAVNVVNAFMKNTKINRDVFDNQIT